MLRDNLIRNGVDLVIDSNLAYFDVLNRRLGINTTLPMADFDVRGIIRANTIVAGQSLNVGSGNNSNYPSGVTSGQMRFNTDLSALEYYDGSNWNRVGIYSVASPTSDVFNGNDVTSSFTLSQNSTTQATFVTVNGVGQIPGVSYSVTGNTLSFISEIPQSTDIVEARILAAASSVYQIANGNNRVLATYNGSLGQVNVTTDGVNSLIVTTNAATINNAVAFNGTGYTVGTANVTVDSFGTSSYRAAKYIITAVQGSNYEVSEALVIHNGSATNITTYGTTVIGSPLLSLYAVISSGNTLLYAKSTSSSTSVKLSKTYIAV